MKNINIKGMAFCTLLASMMTGHAYNMAVQYVNDSNQSLSIKVTDWKCMSEADMQKYSQPVTINPNDEIDYNPNVTTSGDCDFEQSDVYWTITAQDGSIYGMVECVAKYGDTECATRDQDPIFIYNDPSNDNSRVDLL